MDIVLAVTAVAIRRKRDLGDVFGRVTGVAIDAAMRASQRIFRLRVMIEAPAGPSVRIVAKRAIGAQPAGMMLILVAARAGDGRALVRRGLMALFAWHDRVAPNQRKPRQVVIEGRRLAPSSVLMALLATIAELTPMRIVLAMAGHAGRGELLFERSGVARIALDLDVSTPKRKPRLVVIEARDDVPAILIVAALAFRAVAAGVHVLYLVTSDARRGDAGIALADVTNRTGDALVRTQEREFGRVVIELLDTRPGRLAVATLTFLTKPPLVRIVRLVTIKTDRGHLSELGGGSMAFVTTDRGVRTLQLKIREDVVKSLPVKLNDIGAAALVIDMTISTFLLCRGGLTAVKALMSLTIRRGFLMASEALRGLRLPGKRRVALHAILFQLGMPLDQRPRHDQLFKHIL